MDESMKSALDILMARVETKSKELAELKRTVNSLAREAGGEPIYSEEALATEPSGLGGIQPDQFYGKSPITAAREYLDLRRRAVPAEEILAALERGGFDFEEQGWKKPADRLRSLAISLSKNSIIFHRLPNGTYGLVKFYPDIADKKQKRAADAEETPEEVEKG